MTDILSTIALIQCHRQTYAACGINLQPRINDYLSRQKWSLSLLDLSEEQLSKLAEAMQTAYEAEKLTLKPAQSVLDGLRDQLKGGAK